MLLSMIYLLKPVWVLKRTVSYIAFFNFLKIADMVTALKIVGWIYRGKATCTYAKMHVRTHLKRKYFIMVY